MTIDADGLTLVQWLSPSFPTGAFAYSHGLEWAIAAGEVTDETSLHDWIADILCHGSGRTDAILLAQGLHGDLDALSDLAVALAGSAERLRETREQGAAFASITSDLTGLYLPARPLPLAIAQAARTLDLRSAQVVALSLHAFAANLVSVAVRLVPLGQTAGQRVLSRLRDRITQVADLACSATLADIATTTFRAEIAAMRHEIMDVRIFKT